MPSSQNAHFHEILVQICSTKKLLYSFMDEGGKVFEENDINMSLFHLIQESKRSLNNQNPLK